MSQPSDNGLRPINPMIEWDVARLKRKSKPVRSLSEGKKVVEDLLDVVDTFYKDKASGLAAPQIGIFKRVFLIHAPIAEGVAPPPMQVSDEWQAFINPVVLASSGEGEIDYDGCLSFPGLVARTMRVRRIKVQALNCPEPLWLEPGEDEEREDGRTIIGPGPSIYFQHELDHLNGVLFFERAFVEAERQQLVEEVKQHQQEIG